MIAFCEQNVGATRSRKVDACDLASSGRSGRRNWRASSAHFARQLDLPIASGSQARLTDRSSLSRPGNAIGSR